MFDRTSQFISRLIPPELKTDSETYRRARLVVGTGMLSAGVSLAFLPVYLLAGYVFGIIFCVSGAMTLPFVLFMVRRAKWINPAGNFLCAAAYFLFVLFSMTSKGVFSPAISWLILVPLGAFLLVNRKSGLIWTAVCLCTMVAFYLLEFAGIEFPLQYDGHWAAEVHGLTYSGLLVLLVLIVYNYESGKERVTAKLQTAKQAIETRNEQIRTINAGLEKQIDERTDLLRRANAELDTFLYESAHSLRRPLMRIKGLKQLIAAEPGPGEKHAYLDNIDQTIEGMDRLLHKLIAAQELRHREPVASETNVAKMVHQLSGTMRGRGLPTECLAVVPGKTGEFVVIDAFHLQQVVENVLENALQYAAPDSTGRTAVEVRYSAERGIFRFDVWNTGPAISPEHADRIFEMFYRVSNRSGSNGLGLFLAKKAVDRLEGKIGVVDSGGKGTRIEALIPLAKKSTASDPRALNSPAKLS